MTPVTHILVLALELLNIVLIVTTQVFLLSSDIIRLTLHPLIVVVRIMIMRLGIVIMVFLP